MTAVNSPKMARALWLIMATVLLAVAGTDVSAKLYRWVDEDGVVHYSDKLPPEASKNAHEEIDERGHTVMDVERIKTKEERMEQELRQRMQEQELRLQAEEQARKRRKDQILLQTFTTERDLLITRDDRLEAIDSIINLTESNNERLKEQMDDAGKRIESMENSGREVPANLAEKFQTLRAQYEKNREFIASKRRERTQVGDRFEADLQRFRELKGLAEAPGDAEQAASAPGDSDSDMPAAIEPAPSDRDGAGPETAEVEGEPADADP